MKLIIFNGTFPNKCPNLGNVFLWSLVATVSSTTGSLSEGVTTYNCKNSRINVSNENVEIGTKTSRQQLGADHLRFDKNLHLEIEDYLVLNRIRMSLPDQTLLRTGLFLFNLPGTGMSTLPRLMRFFPVVQY